MAFTSEIQTKRAARTGRDVPVLMHVDDVNPQAGTLTCTVSREDNPDNLDVEPGQYTVQMDTLAIPSHKRQESAQRATGSFYGGLITDKTMRKKGQHLLAEGFSVTAPGQATARWLNSSRAALTENRAGLVHTRQVKRSGQDIIETSGMTILDTEAFNIWEGREFSERMRETLSAADTNYERGTVPSNKRDAEGRVWIWSSMPSTSMMFAVFDNQAQQVIETTNIYNRNTNPDPSDYPDYLGPEERQISGPRGTRKRTLPLNGEKFSGIASAFSDYARDKYQGQDVSLIAIRGTRTEATRQKDPRNFDMQSSASDQRPLTVCHQENQAAYRLDPNDDTSLQYGLAFVRTAAVSFARNTGDTFSKFASYKHGYPETGQHFLNYIRYQGTPMGVHPALSTPINAPAEPAPHEAPSNNAQADRQETPSQQSDPNHQQPGANHQQANTTNTPSQAASTDTVPASQSPSSAEAPQSAPESQQEARDPAPAAQDKAAGQFDVVDHDAPNPSVHGSQPANTPEPNKDVAPRSDHSAPESNPRLDGFISASGGSEAETANKESISPDVDGFDKGGEPSWLHDYSEDTSLEESQSHVIDTSNNPAESTAPVRSTKFDMPFGP